MGTPLLQTKLYIPPTRPESVPRPRLIERLNAGLHRKLTLVSAPAGFGKTMLVSSWLHQLAGEQEREGEGVNISLSPPLPLTPSQFAWLSLDEGDNDLVRFLTYFTAALQTIEADIGKGALSAIQSPQPPPTEAVLTSLLNEIAALPDRIILVLDDYHLIEAQTIHQALTLLLEHLPPQMHLVIATREDPHLPLARLRARGQLTELRVTDLRFTFPEAAGFLNQAMGLNLSAEDIAALETRTEGWIAGLQLAAISMQGHKDATSFIKSFTGSHHFVLDYLAEEVLQQQSESVQTFLLRTSILDRLCGPLCDAVLSWGSGERRSRSEREKSPLLPRASAPQRLDPSAFGQETLEYLERANLFIIPLDNERRWYRYHHLFADLLRQRLLQSVASSTGDEGRGVAELHRRASVWYEDNGLEIEAFHHAAAANDIERAGRLIEGKGMPLHFRGAVAPVLNWLASLPTTVLDARPSLWVMYASALSMTGQLTAVEQKLQTAEAALQDAEPDDRTRNLIGHIAAIRALLAASQRQVESIIAQSRRALKYLHPDNLAVRTATIWKLGIAYQLQGDRAAASQSYTEAISISQASGNTIINISASTGLGQVQEAENQLHLAAQTYRRILQLAGDPPQPAACEAHLGLARIFYQWNDLDAAQQHGQQSVQLASQLQNIDSLVSCEIFLARLKLAQGDVAGAAAILAKAGQSVRRHNFAYRMPEVAAAQVLILLHQGNLATAAHLAEKHELPISRVRVHLAQGDTSTAPPALWTLRQKMEAKGWEDERLKVMVLQAVAHHTHGEKDKAAQLLGDALALAEPGGFIRIFVDEGLPMAQLLSEAAACGIMPDYVRRLLAAFEEATNDEGRTTELSPSSSVIRPSSLVEPLSERELEVLQLIAQGLSNREISERLFLALSTVKGHNRNIFGKLESQRRTEAVARARELGLL
ncbi:MAG: LuxR family transcriptional regulator [Anaerolineaceae bacterium 4572_5.2]|nr:MAG: LuxR family transcriptional regulator [Anaerolineaceae bacterium 4572_5.2]